MFFQNLIYSERSQWFDGPTGDQGIPGTLIGQEYIDPEIADLIVEKMFVFEDFLDVEDSSLETLLLEVPQNVLIMALKGASPKLRDKIFGNLTRRSAERIRDELDTLPPVRVSEVQENQREIIQLARKLAGEGRIYLRSAHKDDLI